MYIQHFKQFVYKTALSFTGLEELPSLCGFMAPAVYLAALWLDHCLTESLWSEPTVFTMTQIHLQLIQPLLVERVELRW